MTDISRKTLKEVLAAAGGRQMLVLNFWSSSAGAKPLHTTHSSCIRREREGLSGDDCVSIATVLDVDDAEENRYVINVFALDVATIRQTSN